MHRKRLRGVWFAVAVAVVGALGVPHVSAQDQASLSWSKERFVQFVHSGQYAGRANLLTDAAIAQILAADYGLKDVPAAGQQNHPGFGPVSPLQSRMTSNTVSCSLPNSRAPVPSNLARATSSLYRYIEVTHVDIGDGISTAGQRVERVRNQKQAVAESHKTQLDRYLRDLDANCPPEISKAFHAFLEDASVVFQDVAEEKLKSRIARELSVRLENAQLQEQRQKRLDDLKTGRATLQSVNDGLLLYKPSNGSGVVLQPKLSPDQKVYVLVGALDRAEGKDLVFQMPSNQVSYFIGRLSAGTKQEPGFEPRYNTVVRVLGKYIDNTQYTTVAGTVRTSPVFEIIVMGPPE
ncbi:MAG TPA: hypothetical protein VFA81_05835 [Burkholderiales bacterium]|nr:hypothetical protein [Burkholderiales bacterium]